MNNWDEWIGVKYGTLTVQPGRTAGHGEFRATGSV